MFHQWARGERAFYDSASISLSAALSYITISAGRSAGMEQKQTNSVERMSRIGVDAHQSKDLPLRHDGS